MAFTPIITDKTLTYANDRPNCFRNTLREEEIVGGNPVGSPVYFNPSNTAIGVTGYPGPKYQYHKNYNNSTSNIKGNCTWWCWGRLADALNVRLPFYGDGVNWYTRYQADGGSVDTDATNIQPGDIICFSSSEPAGHVMFVEKVVGNDVYISQSAYSSRSIWTGYACRCTIFDKADIYAGHSIDMYKDIDSPFSVTTIGILHTGEESGYLDPVTISVIAKIILQKGGNFNVKL